MPHRVISASLKRSARQTALHHCVPRQRVPQVTLFLQQRSTLAWLAWRRQLEDPVCNSWQLSLQLGTEFYATLSLAPLTCALSQPHGRVGLSGWEQLPTTLKKRVSCQS